MGSTIKVVQTIQTIFAFIISLTTVLGIFTAIINKSFAKKLKPIEDRMDKETAKALEKSMLMWRFEIVTFASELHNGAKKSTYEFDAIFTFIDEYSKAVKQLNIKNSLFEAEEEFIRETYKNIVK